MRPLDMIVGTNCFAMSTSTQSEPAARRHLGATGLVIAEQRPDAAPAATRALEIVPCRSSIMNKPW